MSEELGIDSIRRTEILASVCDAGSFDSSSLDMEALSRAETVKGVIVAVEKELQGVSAPVRTVAVAPTQNHVKKTSLDITSLVVDAVADATGFESSEIDLSQSLSEELGIDSIRRTEILASVCDAGSFDSSSLDMEALSRAETVKDVIVAVEKELQGVSAPVRTTLPPSQNHVKKISLDITSLVVDAVADATGFESSEIDLSQSLSEELGIDSIRRTEILASVCDAGSFDSSSLDMEALSRAETVKDVIEAVEKELKGVFQQQGKAYTSNNAGDGPHAHQLGKEYSSNNAGDGPTMPTIAIAHSTTLSAPHQLDLSFSSPVLIVSHRRSDLADSLCLLLQSRGIATTRLDPALGNYEEKSIVASLSSVSSLSGCIHIHESSSCSHDQVRYVLLLAKHVSSRLKKSNNTRSFFFSVSTADRKTLQDVQFGGVSGLCKSLDLEWDSVFCRHVDMDSTLDLKKNLSMFLLSCTILMSRQEKFRTTRLVRYI